MEQNVRPAPDNDLEAYGDWVTVDSAAIPPAAVRQPPAATADVEIAAELTDAEEEFLGRVSDADHAAAATVARDAGHPVHNGNGNGNGNGRAEPGVGHPGSHVGGPAAADTPAPAFTDEPARSPGIARRPASSDQPPPSDRLALAAGAAASAADSGAPDRAAAAGGAGITASSVPLPPPAVTPAPLPAVHAAPAEQPAAVPAETPAPAPAPANSAPDLPAPPLQTAPEAGGDRLADLERRVAALAADLGAIAAEVGRLQAGGDPGEVPAGQVQVSLEELDSEPAAEPAAPAAQAADAAQAAAGTDSQAAPVIRLVPIAEEEDEHAAHLSAESEAQGLAGATEAAGASPPEASPAPSDDSFRNDVRDVLGYLDQLLDDLPPERVREFAQSSHFTTYKALFTELGLDE